MNKPREYDDEGCHILHVDMDAFFASIELRDNPDLVGKPVVVGGNSARGVVAAASYEARRFGVRSAMSMQMAQNRCPGLVIVAPRIHHYRQVSREVMKILGDITPVLEQVSVDEAYLNVKGALRHFGSPMQIAELIRQRIRTEVGLPASVGVAKNKSVAKIASNQAKPNGVFLVPVAETEAFLAPLPIETVWGIGKVAAQKLHQKGIRTLGQLRAVPPHTLDRALGAQVGAILAIARGEDQSLVKISRVEKSIGTEKTFDEDVADLEKLLRVLRGQCDEVAWRLRRHEHAAKTVAIKVRFADGQTVTRSLSRTQALSSSERVYEAAATLLKKNYVPGQRVRLLGVRVENFALPLAQELHSRGGWGEMDDTLDRLREKFGSQAIARASFISPADDSRSDEM